MRRFIIDTDTASDDAVAILMALRWPDVEVAAITVVSGNVPVEQGVRNALTTVELCGSSVPVHMGASRPLRREPYYADWFHGRDGMGDMNYPAPARTADPVPAVDALIAAVENNPGVTLVTLGPLTNIAQAIDRRPSLVDGISRCIVMGGASCAVGNITPAAEYNIWVDPDAARAVFHSGMNITMVGWELCRGEANLLAADMQRLQELDTPFSHFTLDSNRVAVEANRKQCGDPGMGLPDPVAMAVALDPSICTRSGRHYVTIETQSELTRGATVIDELGVAKDPQNSGAWGDLISREPNATVCWEIDIARWKDALFGVLR